MKLSELLNGCTVLEWKGEDLEVLSVETCSTDCRQGCVFVCLTGGKTDAHLFAEEAIQNGAVALVTERIVKFDGTKVLVRDTRETLARMAQNLYGNPSDRLITIAVVGTNGKTTTAHMIKAVMENCGKPTCILGTNGYSFMDEHEDYGMTTPDPLVMQKYLARALRHGCQAAVMEVSAHAIKYHKTGGMVMDLAVFTNFSRDHLDFFGDMAHYAQTKASFFTPLHANRAVINVDDPLGVEILMSTTLPTVTYGVTEPADVFAIDYRDTEDGADFVVNMEDEIYDVALPMHGEYNMSNALAAIAAGHALGLPLQRMADALRLMPQVAGRYQCFDVKGVKVVVDYAHTPDGVAKILDSISEWVRGKVIAVFGCGGNRDKSKRPMMARAAEMRSDLLVITSDNPRMEDPASIVADICKGLTGQTKTQVVLERSAAIRYAVQLAAPGDVVAILGKGNETYMDIGGRKRAYCDLDIIDMIQSEQNL